MAEKRKNAGKSNLLSSAQEITKDETIPDAALESPTSSEKKQHSPLLTRSQQLAASGSRGSLTGSGGILKNSGSGPTKRELTGSSSSGLRKEVVFVDSPTSDRKKRPRNILTASAVLRADSKYIYFRIAAALLLILGTYTAWSTFHKGPGKAGFRAMPSLVLQHIDNGSYVPIHDGDQSLRVFYRDNGRRGREPVVLLHGIGSSSFSYRKVLPELAQNGIHAIAFDFPGLGLSESPSKGNLTWHYYSETIGSVLEAFQVKKVHLVLHGTSAPVGLEYATRYPHKIKSITFVAPTLDVSSLSLPFPFSLFSIPYVRQGAAKWLATPFTGSINWLLFRLRGSNRVTQEEVSAYTYLMGHSEGGESLMKAISGADLSQSHNEYLAKSLSSLAVPVQLIHVDDDSFGSSKEYFTQKSKAATVNTIQAKHLVQEDRPKELSKQITIFVNQVSPPTESDHAHSHAHGSDHAHSHSHGSDHAHSHSHGSDHAHSHSHGSDHAHSHSHESDHEHTHGSGGHDHSHGHHNCPGAQMMGGHNYGL
eukprot:TRINITY_DN4036_c0_g1_i1.p1 TRINITY_DN4036_c0_g1~~TRINITY_DN4036_c0_g1_i1.p1  ORF type:complete len:535 (+),score=133.98 TRINITY_DN4036_c0_g1_i1:143-1747(+)